MREELKRLVELKEKYTKELNEADENGKFAKCLMLGNKLNEIDAKIRQIATEEEMQQLYKKNIF